MNNTKSNELKDKLKAMKHLFKCEQVGSATLFNADNLAVLREMPDNSIDSCVTDGPYGVSRLGNAWDSFVPKAIKNGINRKDGAGISPSMFSGDYDISRQGAVKFQQFSYEWAVETLRVLKPGAHLISFCSPRMYHRMATGIEDAGFEIIDQMQRLFGAGLPKSHNISKAIDKLHGAVREIVGENQNRKGRRNWDSKPKNITLPATTDAKFWEGFGTGLKSLNEPILLARKPISEKSIARNVLHHGTGGINIDACRFGEERKYPSNTIIDAHVAEMLGEKAKFYYCPPPSQREKNLGCDFWDKSKKKKGNTHSTVKSVAIMEYLVKLVTPPNGICIDIFAGSGTTGIACVNQGFKFIGVEIEPEYYEIAKARIQHWQNVKKVA